MRLVLILLSVGLWGVFLSRAQPQDKRAVSEPVEYVGTYDASAAVPLNDSVFVVANDEDNVLRVYDRRRGGKPVADFDLSRHLDLGTSPKESKEVDIEGATRLGDRVYWISSHGTGKIGDERLERRRFFATRFTVADKDVRMELVGKPCKTLLDDMIASPQLKKYDLAAAAKVAPKQGGFNIEAIAATPTGSILIGLRCPLGNGNRAIVVPLLNPDAVIQGEKARFADPKELDLGGLGLRGLEYWPARKEYVVLAGPKASGACRIFRWSGRSNESPLAVEGVNLDGWCPETCVMYPDMDVSRIQIISDDGEFKPAGGPPRFRSAWVRF